MIGRTITLSVNVLDYVECHGDWAELRERQPVGVEAGVNPDQRGLFDCYPGCAQLGTYLFARRVSASLLL